MVERVRSDTRSVRGTGPASWPLGVLVAGLVLLVPIGQAVAQGLTAQGLRDLQFGTVVAGLSTSVPRTDIGRVAFFQVRGTSGAEVLIQLTLPTVLVNGGGQTLPIAFGPNDGGWGALPIPFFMTSFDPTVPLIQRLSGFGGRLYVALGGTVNPPISTAAGQYANTVTLTVSYTGN